MEGLGEGEGNGEGEEKGESTASSVLSPTVVEVCIPLSHPPLTAGSVPGNLTDFSVCLSVHPSGGSVSSFQLCPLGYVYIMILLLPKHFPCVFVNAQ